MPPKSTHLRPVAERRVDAIPGAEGIDFKAVQRFVRAIPDLQRVLASPAACDRELLLRAHMQRTLKTLAATFDVAARGERRKVRAALYRAAALVAAKLAAAPDAPARRDH